MEGSEMDGSGMEVGWMDLQEGFTFRGLRWD